MDGPTDRWTDRPMGQQTYRSTDWLTYAMTNGLTDWRTYRQSNLPIETPTRSLKMEWMNMLSHYVGFLWTNETCMGLGCSLTSHSSSNQYSMHCLSFTIGGFISNFNIKFLQKKNKLISFKIKVLKTLWSCRNYLHLKIHKENENLS